MADRETRTHRTGNGDEALTGSGYRSGLESITTTPPQTVQQIQQIQQITSQSQTTSGADSYDIDD